MALTPTEREEHFFKAMVDAADGRTPEELEPTERKEHWYKEIIDAIKVGGGGSGGGVLVVTDTEGTLDKTWQEIHDAMLSGGAAIHRERDQSEIVSVIRLASYSRHEGYVVATAGDAYSATSASGYPSLS